jgi:folylpolyglutamate synthase/dihydropteroate synthase
VAHNLDAVSVLINKLEAAKQLVGLRQVVCVLGVMADKTWTDMIQGLQPWVSRWLLVQPNSPRSVPAATLAETVERIQGQACGVDDARSAALVTVLPGPPEQWPIQVRKVVTAEDVVLVCGSFFTVGPFYADARATD